MLPWRGWDYLIVERREEVQRLLRQQSLIREALLAGQSSEASTITGIISWGKRVLMKVGHLLRFEKRSPAESDKRGWTGI